MTRPLSYRYSLVFFVGAFLILALVYTLVYSPSVHAQDTNASVGADVRADTREDSGVNGRTQFQTGIQKLKTDMLEKREHFMDRRQDAMGAVNDTRTDVRTDIEIRKQEAREALEERRDAFRDRVDDRRANLRDAVKERIDAFVDRIVRRFNAAIERLHSIADRIDSRIEKMEERGLDLSEASDAVLRARADLDKAATLVAQFHAQVDVDVESDAFRDSFARTRTMIQAAKELLRSAHGHLREAVVEIKASLPQQKTETNVNVENDSAGETDVE